MSYALVNPPPTAGPLPVIDSASLGVPYYAPASGGGGGGAGPNPVVSTLTFAQGDITEGNGPGSINMSFALNVRDLAVSTPQNYSFQFATAQDPTQYSPDIAAYQSTMNVFQIWGPSASQADTGNVLFTTDVLGRSAITALKAAGGLSTLAILADTVQMPTDLQVSSINGVAPSGGGVSPLGISTAQVAGSAGALSLVGPTSLVLSSVNVNALGVNNFNLGNGNLNVSSINGASPAGGGVDPAGISTNVVSAASGTLLTLNSDSTTTQINIDSSKGGQIDINAAAGAGTINLGAVTLNASAANLQISSINGVAPGGGSIANVSVSTVSSGFVFAPGGPGVVPLTSSFATTAGNLYQLSWTDVTQVITGGMVASAYLQYTLSTPSGFVGLDLVPIAPYEATGLSTIVSHIANFTASADSANLALAPNGILSTIVSFQAGQNVIVRDLGPIV